MITALDHIAIAVPDLQRSIYRFMQDFGITFDGTEDVEVGRRSDIALVGREAEHGDRQLLFVARLDPQR